MMQRLTQLAKAGAAILLIGILAAPRAAEAAPAPIFVSARQAFVPLAATTHGASALYLNVDPGEHAVRSDTIDPATGEPVFWSPVAGVGEAVTVHNIERLAPGTYGFYCSYHTGMRGMLLVLDP